MLLASWLSLMSLVAMTPTLAAEPGCPPTSVFNTSLDHLDGYRVFTGPDGTSQVAPLRIDSKVIPLMKTGKRLGILQLPTSPTRGVEIVVGPPNVDLPMHPAPGKEMFVLLGGSVTLTTKTFSADMKPGSVLLFEDVDSKDGHGGRVGPCGYISLSIAR